MHIIASILSSIYALEGEAGGGLEAPCFGPTANTTPTTNDILLKCTFFFAFPFVDDSCWRSSTCPMLRPRWFVLSGGVDGPYQVMRNESVFCDDKLDTYTPTTANNSRVVCAGTAV